MRIAIIGAGGVGGYFGAKLGLSGHDVHFVARGRHLAAMRDGGLRIRSDGGDFAVASPHATDDPHTVGAVDAVLIAAFRLFRNKTARSV
jgi:2-dehydropantoate 2-reductase